MARTARTATPAPRTLTRAETCTTAECTAPRIRLNALKCTEHEIVYRAAAKQRALARKAALAAEIAAAAEIVAPAPKRATRDRPMGSGPVARNAKPTA